MQCRYARVLIAKIQATPDFCRYKRTWISSTSDDDNAFAILDRDEIYSVSESLPGRKEVRMQRESIDWFFVCLRPSERERETFGNNGVEVYAGLRFYYDICRCS